MFARSAMGLLLLCFSSFAWGGTVVIPSDVSVQLSAEPDSGLVTGQPITFTFSVTNHGPEPVPTLVVSSSDFTNEFNLALGTSDCSNLGLVVVDGKSFYYYYDWVPSFGGAIEVGETRSCHLTLPVGSQAPDIWAFGLSMPSSYQDLDGSNNASEVTLRRVLGVTAPIPVPAMSPIALLFLALLMFAVAVSSRRLPP
jgi:hypothetical protein